MSSFLSWVKHVRTALNPPASPEVTSPLRFGILGTAKICRIALVSPASNHPETVVYAIASRDEQRAKEHAEKWGIGKSYGGPHGYQSLIDDPNVDVVYVPLPNGLHFEWTMKALSAGKHVLVEKPICDTADEARQMFELAERKGVVLMEGFHYRFHPAIQRAKAILDSGELGPIKNLSASMSLPKGMNKTGDNRNNFTLGGGATMDIGCYAIGCIRHLASSEPTAVLSATSTRHAKPTPDEELIDVCTRATLSFPNDVTGTIYADLEKPGWGPFGLIPSMADGGVIVKCERGELNLNNFFMPFFYHSITVRVEDVNGKIKERVEKAYAFGDGRKEEESWTTFRHQLDAYVDKVKGRTPKTWIYKEDSIGNITWIENVYEKTGLGSRPKSEYTFL